MVNDLAFAVELLIKYWSKQSIPIAADFSMKKISADSKDLFKFDDFVYFYSCVNGMKDLYPNYNDEKGFLFYPSENLIFYERLNSDSVLSTGDLVVFADCLQRCWVYAVRIIDSISYEIVLVESPESYKRICASLTDFLYLYMNDSDFLY